jgi:hypothetical protein
MCSECLIFPRLPDSQSCKALTLLGTISVTAPRINAYSRGTDWGFVDVSLSSLGDWRATCSIRG